MTLQPGQHVTVTLTTLPSTAVIQGTLQRVAVEGTSGGVLIGGIVADIYVPVQMAFVPNSGRYFIPILKR